MEFQLNTNRVLIYYQWSANGMPMGGTELPLGGASCLKLHIYKIYVF